MSKSGFAARIVPAIAILAVVAGASAPAMARTTEEKLAKMAAAPTKVQKAPVRYCFVDVDPATRAEQRDCRTRAAWIRDEGIDPSW